jgi:nitronate monooxygenase
MPLPPVLEGRLTLPLVCAPMFLVSGPELVVAACRAGVVGAFPTINARDADELDRWLTTITGAFAADREAAPAAANLIVHRSNPRLPGDLEVVVEHEVPLVITSVGDPGPVVDAVHGYGGAVLHDVATVRHAERAVDAGVDGMVLLTAGAGGQTGARNPLAFVREVRVFWDGPLAVAGGITDGHALLAVEAAGADLGYAGTAFIATTESRAVAGYKDLLVEATGDDVVLTRSRTGLPANMLRQSLERAGWSAQAPPPVTAGVDLSALGDDATSPWRDVWSAGHGAGAVEEIRSVAQVVERFRTDHARAWAELSALRDPSDR